MNTTCSGCNFRVAKPIKCSLCGIASHPSCLPRTGHPFNKGKFLSCRVNVQSPSSNISNLSNSAITSKVIREIIREELKVLRDDIKAEIRKLELDIIAINDRVSNMEESLICSNNSSNLAVDYNDIVSEIEERNWRSNNIILFNVDENIASTSSAPPPSDEETVNNIIRIIDPSVLPGSRMRRIGRRSSHKSRPICLTLRSKKEVLSILKNKSKYSGPVVISQDRTKGQRDYLRALRSELKARAADGNLNLTIKYFNGDDLSISNAIADIFQSAFKGSLSSMSAISVGGISDSIINLSSLSISIGEIFNLVAYF
ncbi:hypothetical protein M0802_016766 [Mischocyttarus mexicanus]|nr:hypothetical protein M0802_016766 [Mischocyttarus mexicanus]